MPDPEAVSDPGAVPEPEATSGPKGTVTSFLAALERLDVDAALSLAAEDIVYQNVPLRPARGITEVARQLRWMIGHSTGFEARIHHIAADGPVVLTERTDVLKFRAWEAKFWVCGTFEVRDGRVILWRDYFDWTTFLAAGARGLGRALAGPGQRALARRAGGPKSA
jgi:limonene-1,2-epoxide hydrolase